MRWAFGWTIVCAIVLLAVGILVPYGSPLKPLYALAQPVASVPFVVSSLIVAHMCRPLIRWSNGLWNIPVAASITALNMTLFFLMCLAAVGPTSAQGAPYILSALLGVLPVALPMLPRHIALIARR